MWGSSILVLNYERTAMPRPCKVGEVGGCTRPKDTGEVAASLQRFTGNHRRLLPGSPVGRTSDALAC
jgi:hypothetical protein